MSDDYHDTQPIVAAILTVAVMQHRPTVANMPVQPAEAVQLYRTILRNIRETGGTTKAE
jgi:hypothetical protein